jgi:hypothetical protein
LAYRDKGIGYSTYFTPQVGNYHLAPIDRLEKKKKTWEMMRNINLQIHAPVPVYSKLRSVNVLHTGNIPRNSRGIDSAKIIESVNGSSLLIGEFVDNEGKPYAMIVKKNMQSSVSFDVQFKKKGKVMLHSQFNKEIAHFEGEQKWLAPGCGILLTVIDS